MNEVKANLDAWHVLQTVIDAGGFAQAAEALQRSQSAISYSMSKLQDQLQLDLLTIEGRRAVLTDSGQLLLSKARQVLGEYEQLLEFARHLRRGYESELSLWLDGHYSIHKLQPALQQFQQAFPDTRLNLLQGLRMASANDADVIMSAHRYPQKRYVELQAVELLAVAQAQHPLFLQPAPLTRNDLMRYVRVSLETASLAAEPVWSVTNMSQAKEYVVSGLAYGWLPKELIEAELEQQTLKTLPIEQGQHYQVPMYLQLSQNLAEGPAMQALVQQLSNALAI